VRYFLSTGEASGELSAVRLARAIRRLDGDAHFEGIGSRRMAAEDISLWRDHTGWASMGPLAAIPRIPALLAIMYLTALHIARSRPDALVCVDFGAFNVRLAKTLRRMRYRGAIVDVFPPGTWLDDASTARLVARVALPLTAFAHQRDFYASLGLRVAYHGHPLAPKYRTREARTPPRADGGTVALLPGSRKGELRYHVPALLEAYRMLKALRPKLNAIVGAADAAAESDIRARMRRSRIDNTDSVSLKLSETPRSWLSSNIVCASCRADAIDVRKSALSISPRVGSLCSNPVAGASPRSTRTILERPWEATVSSAICATDICAIRSNST